jgi:hypothetical protein
MTKIAWFCLCVLVACYLSGPLVDPDLWWHITVGKWIIAHQQIPEVDLWNRFSGEQHWRAYSWLTEVLFAAVWQQAGEQGLWLVKLVFALLLCCGLSWIGARMAGDAFIGGALGLFAALSSFNHFTLRPQSLVWLFFGAVILISDRVLRHGWTKGRALALVCCMSLWANCHITVSLGLAGIALWSFTGIKDLPRIFQLVGLAFLGTLITPYFGGEWLTFLSKTGHPFQHRAIAEFQPATIVQYDTGFLVFALCLLLIVLHRLEPRAMAGRLIGCGGFTIAALAVIKFLPFAVLFISLTIARLWRDYVYDRGGDVTALGPLGEAARRVQAFVLKIPREGASFLMMCLAFVLAYPTYTKPVHQGIVPVSALDFIIERSLEFPLLNGFGNGGYVMYRLSDAQGLLSPERKVPIDGRTNVGPPEVWQEFIDAHRARSTWRVYFERVKPQTVLWKRDSPLCAVLIESPEWCSVFRSGTETLGYEIFVSKQQYDKRAGELQSSDCGGK